MSHYLPSPSHIKGPNVYLPFLLSTGSPVSPNLSCFTGKYSLPLISPLSKVHSSRPVIMESKLEVLYT